MGQEEGGVLVISGFIRGMSLSIACGRVVKGGYFQCSSFVTVTTVRK
jgi:hypothetical protein